MALQKTVLLPNGLEVKDGYHRISGVTVSKSKTSIEVYVFLNRESALVPDERNIIEKRVYEVSGKNNLDYFMTYIRNPIQIAYHYLKDNIELYREAIDIEPDTKAHNSGRKEQSRKPFL